MPWIVLTIISLVLNLVQIIGNLINGYFGVVVSGLVGFVLAFYIFIVVWSYRFLYNSALSQICIYSFKCFS